MHDLLLHVGTYLQHHRTALLSLVGGAAGLSVFLQVVLHKLHVNSKKVAFTLLHVFALITALASYFVANIPSFDVLPAYVTLVNFAQVWHRFVVSPVYTNSVVPFLQYQADQKAAKAPAAVAPVPEATPTESIVAPAPNEFQ